MSYTACIIRFLVCIIALQKYFAKWSRKSAWAGHFFGRMGQTHPIRHHWISLSRIFLAAPEITNMGIHGKWEIISLFGLFKKTLKGCLSCFWYFYNVAHPATVTERGLDEPCPTKSTTSHCNVGPGMRGCPPSRPPNRAGPLKQPQVRGCPPTSKESPIIPAISSRR